MEAAQLKQLKKGRTPEQQKALDYFFEAKSGCFAKPMPDKEFDDVVTNLINTLGSQERALTKVGMDIDDVKEIAPVCFHGYNFTASFNAFDKDAAKVGTDGRLRSSAYEVTWLFFSAEQVFMYNVIFDTLSDSKKERTEEYFYRDITNFSTSTDTISKVFTTVKAGGCMKKAKETSTQSSKEYATFSLIVPGDKFSCSMTGNANAESTVQGMKQKLREKKSSMH